MAQQQQRPMGITILAILGIIGGLFSLFGGCTAVAGGALVGSLELRLVLVKPPPLAEA